MSGWLVGRIGCLFPLDWRCIGGWVVLSLLPVGVAVGGDVGLVNQADAGEAGGGQAVVAEDDHVGMHFSYSCFVWVVWVWVWVWVWVGGWVGRTDLRL